MSRVRMAVCLAGYVAIGIVCGLVFDPPASILMSLALCFSWAYLMLRRYL